MLEWAADHPAANGHFPGDPIIPGALLLAEALRLAERVTGRDFTRCRVSSAKFPSPCRPGEAVELTVTMCPSGVTITGCVAGWS